MKIRRRSTLFSAALLLLWLTAITLGMRRLAQHANVPGAPSLPTVHWPADSTVLRATDRWSLVVFLHPHCPCSLATAEQLNRIMARCGDRMKTLVVFAAPAGVPPGWERGELWSMLSQWPAVNVRTDDGVIEAHRFQATTSGQTMLYDRQGRLRFSGGITAARGHAGDNAGAQAVISLLLTGQAATAATPVFGCALEDFASADAAGGGS